MNYDKAVHELQEQNLDFNFNNLNIKTKWLTVIEDDKPWSFSSHMHSSFEFHVIAKGKCTVTINNTTFSVGAGELYIVPPNVYHSQQSDINFPAVEYGLNCEILLDFKNTMIDPKEFDYILNLFNQHYVNVVKDKYNVAGIFENVFDEAVNKPVGYSSNIKIYIHQIILYSIRCLLYDNLKHPKPKENNIDKMRMERITEFIEDNLSSNLTLKDLSQILYLSEKQSGRVVQRITGKTFHQYLLDLKIQKSQKLLLNPQNKISDIADQLGFSNNNHFSTVFKQKMGLSPQEFRQKNNFQDNEDESDSLSKTINTISINKEDI